MAVGGFNPKHLSHMLVNYFKTGFRNIIKNGLQSTINVIGLALGIACVFLISVYVQHELTYDRFYPGYENLYRIIWNSENPQTRTPHPMAQALVHDFPEVESAVSLSPYWAAGLTREIFSVRNLEKDLRFDEQNALMVDSTFFDVFQLPVVSGDAKKALKSVNGIVLSERASKKYFGDDDPIGKHLAINSDSVLVEVIAVFKDIPERSHFHFDMLGSYVREKSFDPEDEYYTWADFGHYNYLRLKPGSDSKELEAKLMPWARKYITVTDEFYNQAIANGVGFKVQPVTDIHLKSHVRWELEANGNIEYVYIMAAAAFLTLIIACINFMNLMTAKSAERAKEIGIRKTLGAFRRQLSFQFLSESILIALIAVGIAVLLVEASLPIYNSITGQHYNLNYLESIPVLLGIGLLTGILAGVYPSLVLSSIKPHSILKGKYMGSSQGISLRRVLLVVQFSISMALITGVAVIFNQLSYIRDKNLGFKKEELMVVPLKNENVSSRMDALKSELLRVDGVKAVSASSNLPGGQFNQNSISLVEKPEEDIDISETFVDYNFINTLDINIVEGRFFNMEDRGDSTIQFVVNETAAKQLSTESILGHEINWHVYEDDAPVKGEVIGVVKDFHFQSLHEPVRPLLLVFYPAYNHLIIKLDPDNFDTKLGQIKKVYTQFDDSFEFEFSFLDERLNQQYTAEQRTGVIFASFASLAILIACFGLFAMAMLTFNQRMKEISIRKVLGASVSGLIFLLLNDFTKLILVAIVIATPLAWWMMDRWLDNFIYQVGIHPLTFVMSGLILLVISWITLSYFTLKTSRINPAETLKNE
ncbi:ABC transporter permease [bacterium]|nr:ABC transporter permease [bacterium]